MRKQAMCVLGLALLGLGCATPRTVEFERTTHYDKYGNVTGYTETERVKGADVVYLPAGTSGGPAPTMFLWCNDQFQRSCTQPSSWRAAGEAAEAPAK